jgi:uncharacterized protein YecE (DUF72 family)
MTRAPPSTVVVATAGWALPASVRDSFGDGASALARYATRLAGAEINSSFHRPHRRSTYERWAATVPDRFHFAVKLPKTISHEKRLIACDDAIAAFAEESAGLGDKRAVILVQLPPSLGFDPAFAAFFDSLQARLRATIACEPRHPSWFDPAVDAWLVERRIARVAADPARHADAGRPGGWRGLTYYRLHGSPVIYRSAYDADTLRGIAAALRDDPAAARWCVFDNTAASAALPDALALTALLDR